MHQVGKVKSFGTKCKQPSFLRITILSRTHPHHSFLSSFDLFTPFVQQWFHCNHSTLSRDYSRYFPQWSCVTVLLPLQKLSHICLRSVLMKTYFISATHASLSKGPSRWNELQVKDKHGWIQLNEVPVYHTSRSVCMARGNTVSEGLNGYYKATDPSTVELSFLDRHILNTKPCKL